MYESCVLLVVRLVDDRETVHFSYYSGALHLVEVDTFAWVIAACNT